MLSRRLAEALQQALRGCGETTVVELAMTYGEPAVAATLRRLVDAGVGRVLVLPLYPQYSATSTGAALDALADAIKQLRWPPELRTVNDYHDQPAHIEALAQSVEAHWRVHGRAERLLLSFHGIPQRYVAAGDPYALQCATTAQRLAERLGLPPDQLWVSYQSRVGREEWLRPYTDEILAAFGRDMESSTQVWSAPWLQELCRKRRDSGPAARRWPWMQECTGFPLGRGIRKLLGGIAGGGSGAADRWLAGRHTRDGRRGHPGPAAGLLAVLGRRPAARAP